MPVGDQPICPDDEVRRIDPVWLLPRAARVLDRQQNRRNYLLWLGHDWLRRLGTGIG